MDLLEALKTNDPALTGNVLWELGSMGRDDAIPYVLPFLAHTDPDLRGGALRYFYYFPFAEGLTLEMLIDCFKQSSGEDEMYYHYDAAELIRLQGQAGIDFLFSYFDEAVYRAQKWAVLHGLSSVSEQWHRVLPPVDRPALDRLLSHALDDKDDSVIAEAISNYQYLRDTSVWDRIWSLREHESPYIRGIVLIYISRINPDFAFPILLEKLRDPHYLIREYAADELGDIEDLDESRKSEAIEHLRPLLNDEHEDVRECADVAIACLDGTYWDR